MKEWVRIWFQHNWTHLDTSSQEHNSIETPGTSTVFDEYAFEQVQAG
jgi:hypothetical protein